MVLRRHPVAAVALAISVFPILAGRADAQTPPTASDPGRSPVVWTVIGGGIGFGAGLVVGLAKFDDAVYAERKILLTSLICAAGGGVAGALISRRAVRRPAGAAMGEAERDPLWNGMLVGAAAGAGIGLWYVPTANCKTDINPECPRVLRLTVGIPAMAGGAALGALVDRMVRPHQAPTPAIKGATTIIAPVIGRHAVGVYFNRVF